MLGQGGFITPTEAEFHEKNTQDSDCYVQAGLALMVNPPKQGDPSFEQHESEAAGIIASMRRRARIMTDGFNACEGITCNYTEGAMYSFPRLNLPPKARLEPPYPVIKCIIHQYCSKCT